MLRKPLSPPPAQPTHPCLDPSLSSLSPAGLCLLSCSCLSLRFLDVSLQQQGLGCPESRVEEELVGEGGREAGQGWGRGSARTRPQPEPCSVRSHGHPGPCVALSTAQSWHEGSLYPIRDTGHSALPRTVSWEIPQSWANWAMDKATWSIQVSIITEGHLWAPPRRHKEEGSCAAQSSFLKKG